jgi:hypothetical protein
MSITETVEVFLSCVLCLSISTIFANILPNMGQQSFRPTTEKQTSLHILTFPEELFTTIASFIDVKSQLALACTCEKVYSYYKKKCREETVACLCSPPDNMSFYYKYCKVLDRWLSKTGWGAAKVTTEGILTDSQSNNSHLIRALCLDQSLQLPNELKYDNINALILRFCCWEPPTLAILSFLEKLSNLKILKLFSVYIKEDIVPVLLGLSSLEIISLNITETEIRMLDISNCTSLKEIEIYFSALSVMSIVLPSQAKRLKIEGLCESVQIDLSHCIQLQSL